MSTSTTFTSRTEERLKFIEKEVVKLVRGVGDI
jgi:hypothetical protein